MSINRKIKLVKFIFITIFWGFVVYVFLLQTVHSKKYEQMAVSQHGVSIPLLAERGKILDQYHRPLVYNQLCASIRILPQYVRESSRDSVAKLLASYNLKPHSEIINELITKKNLYWFKKYIDYETACSLKQQLHKRKFDNSIIVVDDIKRIYPFGATLASVTGFIGDEKGLAGLEFSYDTILKGTEGWMLLQKDATGNNYAWPSYPTQKPINGNDLVLTINLDIQDIVYRELEKTVNDFQALSGHIIVLDASDGAVLALADYPDYDPQNFKNSSSKLWTAVSVSDEFEPGSVYKLVICAAALEAPNRKTLLAQKYDVSNGFITVSGRKIKDVHNNGVVDFDNIFVKSSNIGVTMLSQNLSATDFYLKQREFGFGLPTGIELPGEANGFIDRPTSITPLRFANIAFGQGLRATLLQLSMAYLTVAHNGELLKPYLVKEIRQNHKVLYNGKKTVVRRVFSEADAQIMKEILASVVTDGTGRAASLHESQVCGKTGTAQKIEPDGKYSATKSVMTFIGFFPKDNPRYLISVMIDEPKKSRFAGEVTCPLFKTIAQKILYLEKPNHNHNHHLLTYAGPSTN
ncbi:MAG: penicillin-binding protein 2 [Candidatus Latescibacteria bacterium]|nr:penicillin-binding protein 2 [Candidatus Latescibacterota bacterium]